MEVYVSPPLAVPAPSSLYRHDRVDLELYGVDHSGPSFAVRVFIDHPNATADTPLADDSSYAGSFYVFGHGPCLGDEGHCEVRQRPINPYDRRPPHPLTRQYHRLPITPVLRQVAKGSSFTATLVTVQNRGGAYQGADLLDFQRLTVVSYS